MQFFRHSQNSVLKFSETISYIEKQPDIELLAGWEPEQKKKKITGESAQNDVIISAY